MTPEQRQRAIELITASNSVKVQFNVPVEDHYSNVHEILILESNAKLLSDLHKEEYSLYMTSKGLSVTKI